MGGSVPARPGEPIRLSADAKRRIKEQLKPVIKQATLLELSPVGDERPPITGTYFGGTPYMERGEEWPSCAECSQPLSFICQFYMKDRKDAGVPAEGLYTFFYCQPCGHWEVEPEDQEQRFVRYHPKPTEKLAIQVPDASRPEERTLPCAVKTEPMVSCPCWETWGRLAPPAAKFIKKAAPQDPEERYREICAELTKREDTCTQIGGYPWWIQSEEQLVCATCETPLVLLAQIDSEEAAGLSWGDAGCLYLLVCEDHPGNVSMTLQCY